MSKIRSLPLTSFHWGTYRVETDHRGVKAFYPFEEDRDPSFIVNGYLDTINSSKRIKTPMVREGWLDNDYKDSGFKRGKDNFIKVGWDTVEKLVVDSLKSAIKKGGNESIYAGSYGWASAGRFHHAQGHLKRFLNLIGGCSVSKNTYSLAAGEVIVPHVLGSAKYIYEATSWQSIIDNTELLVAFGGLPLKNSHIGQGGVGSHRTKEALHNARKAGVEFINISPLKNDISKNLESSWIKIVPSSDTALMLGLAYVLIVEKKHDVEFLKHYTVGFECFESYVLGKNDNVAKTPEWSEKICGVAAFTIIELAHKMAKKRTMISVAWALTRQDHGEQPFWLATVLASMLGQIGLPGGGVGFGYSATNTIGLERREVSFQPMPQGENPINSFIPVSRLTEMLENPNGVFQYNGKKYKYPKINLIWWAGGNPFHHHQDLNRLCAAWRKPDTIIVNEWCWNSLAKHADIVLPCTIPLERNDVMLSPRDPYVVKMCKVIEPPRECKDDFEIFKNISKHFEIEAAFTEGKDEDDWIKWIYDSSKKSASRSGIHFPEYSELVEKGWFRIAKPKIDKVMLEDFRMDPHRHPLNTPSGKIEIFSESIAKFNLSTCAGHPKWFEPLEWLGVAEPDDLHLISNQPKNKLHSQLYHGSVSQADLINGFEPVFINPADARWRGIIDGNVVKLSNQRGSCLASAVISDDVMERVVLLSTGAWFNPDCKTNVCLGGNPNVLCLDKGTSELAQGPTAHSCLVKLELFKDSLKV